MNKSSLFCALALACSGLQAGTTNSNSHLVGIYITSDSIKIDLKELEKGAAYYTAPVKEQIAQAKKQATQYAGPVLEEAEKQAGAALFNGLVVGAIGVGIAVYEIDRTYQTTVKEVAALKAFVNNLSPEVLADLLKNDQDLAALLHQQWGQN